MFRDIRHYVVLVSDVPTYADSLATLSKSRPLLAQALVLAERRRTERLAAYLDGARLRGLEQLFAYLEAAVAAYAEIPSLSGIGFLIERVHADYKTALEATLSGYQGVAADAMRDVMEIECLLMDFAANRGNSDEWLHSDEKLRKRKYVPVRVRERLQECGVEPFSNDDFEPIDYKAHSESLHVNPGQRLSTRGPDPLDEPFPLYGDFGFMEMFEHGDRILLAIELLRIIALGVPDGYEPIGPRDKFNDAHARTHQNQVMMFGFVEGPSVLRERLGREPTAAELLGYVKDEITSKSRPFGPKAEGSN